MSIMDVIFKVNIVCDLLFRLGLFVSRSSRRFDGGNILRPPSAQDNTSRK